MKDYSSFTQGNRDENFGKKVAALSKVEVYTRVDPGSIKVLYTNHI